MRIERIDDMTVKLFITYTDIEARGFKREDLWTNRKRGEEFFWSVMEEVNEEEDFVVEGPLWIQVHAFEKGVEVTISKSKNEDMTNMSEENGMFDDFDNQLNELLSQSIKEDIETPEAKDKVISDSEASVEDKKQQVQAPRTVIFKFDSLESVIDYAYRNDQTVTEFEDLLYMLDHNYYYVVHFDNSLDEEYIHDFYGQVIEFVSLGDVTKVYLDDYGKVVMSHNVMDQVKRYFPQSE
ncbi:adaptor protein MecA [Staphylococcus sp. 11261D007BR]